MHRLQLRWSRAPRALVLLLTVALSWPAAAASRPNILLIVMDTVRFDATAATGTPFLTSLRSQSVLFTNAYSTHDFTPPSHFSMLTGFRDGLSTDDDRVENGVPWQLSRCGYSTFAVAANGLLRPKQMPVLRGFSSFNDFAAVDGSPQEQMSAVLTLKARAAVFGVRPDSHATVALYNSSERLLPLFAEQIRKAEPPYFGFVNLIDAHEPYIPDPATYAIEKDLPKDFDGDIVNRRLPNSLLHPETIADESKRDDVERRLSLVKFPYLLADDLSAQELSIYHRRYLAKIHDLDSSLRAFFDELRKEHLLDNTIVIITSDHGESFGEHGFVTHMLENIGDPEATRHVPLLVVLPPKFHRNSAVVDRAVTLDMLAPTIYELAGVDFSAFGERYSLFPPSLAAFITKAPPATFTARLPERAPQDHSAEDDERAKSLRSLGYIH